MSDNSTPQNTQGDQYMTVPATATSAANLFRLAINAVMACNAADNIRLWDGAAWVTVTGVSAPAITGVNTDTIINLGVHVSRIWLVQEASLSAWYVVPSLLAALAYALAAGRSGGVPAHGRPRELVCADRRREGQEKGDQQLVQGKSRATRAEPEA